MVRTDEYAGCEHPNGYHVGVERTRDGTHGKKELVSNPADHPSTHSAVPIAHSTTPHPNPDLLRIHGDEAARGASVDFAVNVRHPGPPAWLAQALARAIPTLGAYPNDARAREAVAAHHNCDPAEVLIVNGVAEAFALLPHLTAALPTPRTRMIHPSFTEPQAAFHAAGQAVEEFMVWTAPSPTTTVTRSVCLPGGLTLLGNPTNPTGIRYPRLALEQWTVDLHGGVLVVDEAFMDMCVAGCTSTPGGFTSAQSRGTTAPSGGTTVPGGFTTSPSGGTTDLSECPTATSGDPKRPEGSIPAGECPDSLAWNRPRGVIVTRSLTKSFSLAGLRCGYVLADEWVINELQKHRAAWAVNALAIEAVVQCLSHEGQQWLWHDRAQMVEQRREQLALLRSAGWWAWETDAPFMLAVPSTLIDGRGADALANGRDVDLPGGRAPLLCQESDALIDGRGADGPLSRDASSAGDTLPQPWEVTGWGSAVEALRRYLAKEGIAVRRTDTFPGMDGSLLRLAVRPAQDVERLIAATARFLSGSRP